MLLESIRLRARLDDEAPQLSEVLKAAVAPVRTAPGLFGQVFGFDAARNEFFVLSIWKDDQAADAHHDAEFFAALESHVGQAPRTYP